jgi:hypothetical protein
MTCVLPFSAHSCVKVPVYGVIYRQLFSLVPLFALRLNKNPKINDTQVVYGTIPYLLRLQSYYLRH